VAQHRAVVEAIEARDGAAARIAMQAVVQRGIDRAK
jgi:DNA-binding GntR family transcriptional regulator